MGLHGIDLLNELPAAAFRHPWEVCGRRSMLSNSWAPAELGPALNSSSLAWPCMELQQLICWTPCPASHHASLRLWGTAPSLAV